MDITMTVTRTVDTGAEAAVLRLRKSSVRPTTVTTTMIGETTETTTRSRATVSSRSLPRGRTLETGSLLTGTRLILPTEEEEEVPGRTLTGELLLRLRTDLRTARTRVSRTFLPGLTG